MSNIKTSRRYFISEAVLLAVLLLAARVIGIFYSRTATDIRYMETALPTVLYYARLCLQSFAFGTAIAAFVTASSSWGKRSGRQALFVAVLLFFLDAASAFFIDVISGAVSGPGVMLAATSAALGYLWTLLVAILCYLAAVFSIRRHKGTTRAILSASVLYLFGRLFLETVYLIRFLYAVEFAPYPSEIVSIVTEYITILLVYGGVVFGCAYFMRPIFLRVFRQKE